MSKSSKTDIWMPFYIGDYLKDTGRLSTEAHGAYLLLMLDYWSHGAPPADDDGELSSITRLSLEAWRGLRGRLVGFFEVRGGKWFHKRIEAELQVAREKAERARENGKNGGRPRRGEAEQETPEEPAGFSMGSENAGFENPEESSSQSQSHSPANSASKKKREGFRPPSLEEVRAYCAERGGGVPAEQFHAFYTANGWVQGKGKPIKDWKACVITWEGRRSFTSVGARAPKPARVRGEHAETLRL